MLQQTTVTPTHFDSHTLTHRNWLDKLVQSLRAAIWWPDSLPTFALFMSVLSTITAAMIMHIYLSAQILETELLLRELKDEYTAIEMNNADLVWQISQHTSLAAIYQRAQESGYQPITGQPLYVAAADLHPADIAARPTESDAPREAVAQYFAVTAATNVTMSDRNTVVAPRAPSASPGQFASLVQRTSQHFQKWWYGIPDD